MHNLYVRIKYRLGDVFGDVTYPLTIKKELYNDLLCLQSINYRIWNIAVFPLFFVAMESNHVNLYKNWASVFLSSCTLLLFHFMLGYTSFEHISWEMLYFILYSIYLIALEATNTKHMINILKCDALL